MVLFFGVHEYKRGKRFDILDILEILYILYTNINKNIQLNIEIVIYFIFLVTFTMIACMINLSHPFTVLRVVFGKCWRNGTMNYFFMYVF